MKTDILTEAGRFGDLDDMSAIGDGITAYKSVLGSALDNIMEKQTYQQLELLEERKEEIQNMIKKRQRKVALTAQLKNQEKQGNKPTMHGYVGMRKGLPMVPPNQAMMEDDDSSSSESE